MGQQPLHVCRELASSERYRAQLLLAGNRLDECVNAAEMGLDSINAVIAAEAEKVDVSALVLLFISRKSC